MYVSVKGQFRCNLCDRLSHLPNLTNNWLCFWLCNSKDRYFDLCKDCRVYFPKIEKDIRSYTRTINVELVEDM